MNQELETKQIHLGKYQCGDYIVESTSNGLICECDFNGDCDHIKDALESLKKGKIGLGFKMMERSNFKHCKYCDSANLKKRGIRKNKKGNSQLFQCKDCKKRFTMNFGFENMRYDDVLIT